MSENGVANRIEIQYNFRGRSVEEFDKSGDKKFVECHGTFAIGSLFHPTERGSTGDCTAFFHCDLLERLVAQDVVIVEIFPSLRQREDLLPDKVELGMDETLRCSIIRQKAGCALQQAEVKINLPQ